MVSSIGIVTYMFFLVNIPSLYPIYFKCVILFMGLLYPRPIWYPCCSACSEVYSIAWWMRHWGGKTPKRSKAYSNSPQIGWLNRGRWTGADREVAEEDRTTVVYYDSLGRKRYKGSTKLKSSQMLGY